MPDPSVRARLSLEGLSLWTHDTAPAIAIVQALEAAGFVTADDLAGRYAAAWVPVPGPVHGNAPAMRVAPLGAWFAGAPARAAAQAAVSATPTHRDPDDVAGAVAVAVAAATVADADDPETWLALVAGHTGGRVGDRIDAARRGLHVAPGDAADRLRDGGGIAALDAVPFALWCVARHLADGPEGYEAAIRTCIAAAADTHTVGAIIGGVIAQRTGIIGLPVAWRAQRDPLPAGSGWP